MNEVISFSGGKTSAYMTYLLLKDNPEIPVIFANTGKEREETLVFVSEFETYFNKKIHWVEFSDNDNKFIEVNFLTASRKGEPFEALINKRKYLPNVVTRFCTGDLKIKPMKKFIKNKFGWKNWINHVGIRYDEPKRWNPKHKDIYEVNHPLRWLKVTKKEVNEFWENMPFNLNLKSHEGNCDLCFLKGNAKKIQIMKDNPELVNWWIEMESKINSTFVKGVKYEQIFNLSKRKNLFSDFENESISCNCTD